MGILGKKMSIVKLQGSGQKKWITVNRKEINGAILVKF